MIDSSSNITTSSLEHTSDVIRLRMTSVHINDVTTSRRAADGTATLLMDMVTSLLDGALNTSADVSDHTGNDDSKKTNPIGRVTEGSEWMTSSSSPETRSLSAGQLEPTFTGWIIDSRNVTVFHSNYNLYVLYATFVLMMFCFLLAVCWVRCNRRLMLLRYERLPATVAEQRDAKGFVYKPSNGDLLDEEYENTFVGVSIPILQEVTMV